MSKANVTPPIGHWDRLIENLQLSPKELYEAVDRAIQKRQLPDARLTRVDWKEGGLFSAKREYLRATRKGLVLDFCGAPYGTGFFVSWWLAETPSLLLQLCLAIPFVGGLFGWLAYLFAKPDTYYKLDTAHMFLNAIHQAILEVMDEKMSAKGLRALSEAERKPILREFYQR